MHRVVLVLALLACVLPVSAQEDDVERIAFRVISAEPSGLLVIDRGTNDGIEVGDPVFLSPRSGGSYRGTVADADERSAIVEMLNPDLVVEPGTRGEVHAPASRFAPEEAEEPEAPVQGDEPVPTEGEEPPVGEGEGGDEGVEHPEWENQDEEWGPDQPLLIGLRAVRPEERLTRTHGRYYVAGHNTYSSEDDRSDIYLRAGMDMRMENPFGRGGTARFDGEVNARQLELPDEGDDDDERVRLDRFSYRQGGDRFARSSWEAGRFLQRGVPEFGVLDGYEWSTRQDNGDHYGVSLGYMPVPDEDYETGDDLQVSLFYTWVADQREHFTWTTGFQKSWHNGATDRDLLVTKMRYLTESGWDWSSALWLDYYSGGDNLRSGLGFTQAVVTGTHRWDSGDGVDITYRHQEFPDVDRKEFPKVDPDEIEDGRYDRLSAYGWTWSEGDTRYHGLAAAWNDEDETGGDLEAGVDMPLGDTKRGDLTVFGTVAEFNSDIGFRTSYGGTLPDGRWDLLYEMNNHHLDGFSDNRDDLLQHRFRATRDVRFGDAWYLSLSAEVHVYDDENAVTVGAYLQRSFR